MQTVISVQTVKEDVDIVDIRVLMQDFYHRAGDLLAFFIGGAFNRRKGDVDINAAREIMQGNFFGGGGAVDSSYGVVN